MPNYKGSRRQLSEAERLDIVERYASGERVRDIATSYGCAPTTIWGVTKGMVTVLTMERYEQSRVQMQALSVADKNWIAGIIDGEGWVGIGKNNAFNGPRVTVASTDNVMAPMLQKLLGGSLCRKKAPSEKNRRDQWCWDLYTLPIVRAFCEVLGPLLRVKSRQAEVLGSYCESRMLGRSNRYTLHEQGLISELRKLNRRGRRDHEIHSAD